MVGRAVFVAATKGGEVAAVVVGIVVVVVVVVTLPVRGEVVMVVVVVVVVVVVALAVVETNLATSATTHRAELYHDDIAGRSLEQGQSSGELGFILYSDSELLIQVARPTPPEVRLRMELEVVPGVLLLLQSTAGASLQRKSLVLRSLILPTRVRIVWDHCRYGASTGAPSTCAMKIEGLLPRGNPSDDMIAAMSSVHMRMQDRWRHETDLA